MTRLRSLPTPASLIDVYKTYPDPMLHISEFLQSLMRGPSPLSEGERELIGAYVSGLNGCAYCYGSHALIAESFGIAAEVLEGLMRDIDSSSVDERIKPLLRYAGKLTQSPARMSDADAAAVYDAGWDDTALFHTIAVCAYFNFVNRVVEGTGVSGEQTDYQKEADHLIERGYIGTKHLITGQISEGG